MRLIVKSGNCYIPKSDILLKVQTFEGLVAEVDGPVQCHMTNTVGSDDKGL